jgi:predicted heme/steroid binding protein/uncharacterized membrane protein
LPADQKRFTPEELAQFKGAEGQPVYLAYQGRVYDVSGSGLWQGGEHMAVHVAGADLTFELPAAPHGEEVFQRYPQVGVMLESPGSTEALPGKVSEAREAGTPPPPAGMLRRLLRRFRILRRHPHPMVVHFPIAFLVSAPVFTLLYLLTGVRSFEVTGFQCLGGGVLFTPVALITGLATWWYNYEWSPLRQVLIKLTLTPILLALGAGAFAWRWLNPEVLAALGDWTGKVYLGMILVLGPLVSLIGWFGGTLVFPLPQD